MQYRSDEAEIWDAIYTLARAMLWIGSSNDRRRSNEAQDDVEELIAIIEKAKREAS